MTNEAWQAGVLYDKDDRDRLAEVRYWLEASREADGWPSLSGPFQLVREICPLHAGLARLHRADGSVWLVRVLRVTRPQDEGEIEVVSPLPGVADNL